jgi:hypothetical protein
MRTKPFKLLRCLRKEGIKMVYLAINNDKNKN